MFLLDFVRQNHMCQVLNLKVQVYFTHISNRHIHSFVESTPHVECEVGLETRDARKQQVCLKPNFSSFKDHQYEVIFVIGEIRWRVQDCSSLKYKLLFLPCYFSQSQSIVSCTISQLYIKLHSLCFWLNLNLYLFMEASGRILKIVMLTFFYNPHILKHETLTFEQQSWQ